VATSVAPDAPMEFRIFRFSLRDDSEGVD
jgi:hypothetical protein